jgi:hypothetical protein
MTCPPLCLSCLSAAVAFAIASPALAQDRDDDDDDDVTVSTQNESALPEVRANSPSGRFGQDGQIAVSSDAGLSISNTSVSGVDGSTTSVTLRPSVDWFVVDAISLGGFVGVQYDSADGGSTAIISVGPRVGYNLPISARTSVWPKVGISFANTRVTSDDDDGVEDEEASNTAAQLNLFVPVMFHPVPHFFLGLGPALDLDLNGEAKATTIAVRLTIGGWI